MKSEYRELFDEVLRKIGRNILMFQQIEKGLKVLLPFVHSDASTKGIDSFWKYRESAKSKTLGTLMNAFIESVDYNTDYFVERLREIVAERNKLVHHFGELEGFILSTEEGCRACITYLESQYEEANLFYKQIKLFLFSVVVFLRENYAEYNLKVELLYEQFKAHIISDGVEYINLNNLSETVWENTKIVKLLRLAETNTDKIGDMTSLGRAGKFIKSQDPECTPKKYGIKTLKAVLKASALFEIDESQDSQQSSIFILYKSKILN